MAGHQVPHPWDSLGKNTGLGCHFLLQCMKMKSESEVARSCPSQPPHGLQPTRLPCPWNFPGKSTGVGCHCLLRLAHRGKEILLWEEEQNGAGSPDEDLAPVGTLCFYIEIIRNDFPNFYKKAIDLCIFWKLVHQNFISSLFTQNILFSTVSEDRVLLPDWHISKQYAAVFFEMCAFQFQFSSVAQSRLTLCDPVVSRDCSLVAWTSLWGASRCEGFCSCGSVVGVHWFCCSAACGFFLHQRLSCWLLHWQVDSLPLRCQRSPRGIILTRVGCSVQSLSHVWLFATPWTVARQASLSITNTWSLLRLMSIV